MNASISPDTVSDPQFLGRQLSGRWLIVGMFVFAGILTGAMGLYWHFYTLPFREYQNAIAAEFAGSSPRAIGGRIKGHRDQPATLRVVVRSEFNPLRNTDQSEQMASRLFELAQEHTAITDYEVFEVHLYQRQPEQETPYWSKSGPISEWEAAVP